MLSCMVQQVEGMTMAQESIQHVTKTTPDVVAERVEDLVALFPECVTEGKVDFARLRAALGDLDALAGENTYSFSWAGKQEAFRAAQTPSAASLAPAPEESVNWETTRHVFIEGENLEALKLLYKAYYGRVKLIYIDPPYNTGNDFIYEDDYSEPLRAYLEKTGQVDAEGNVLRSHTDASGRYHSDWLSMMYPRLFLARQLLREDGIIFVSIDYHEFYHLRQLMNEVFGEENYIGTIVWKGATDNNPTQIAMEHEYMLCFARSKSNTSTPWKNSAGAARLTILGEYRRLCRVHGEALDDVQRELRRFIRRNAEMLAPLTHYNRVDNRGPYTGSRKVHNPRPGGYVYDVVHPVSGKVCIAPANGYRYPEDRMAELVRDGRILFGVDETQIIQIKEYLEDYQEKLSSVIHLDSRAGSNELADLFGRRGVFEHPKPAVLLEQLVGFTTENSDLVLDFFAGSGSIAQAVLALNRNDGGARRFILVQLPEAVDESRPSGKVALKMGLTTIAEIAKQRVRLAISRIERGAESHEQLSFSPVETGQRVQPEDLGFKVFKLAPSTFRQWEAPASEDVAALERQLSMFDQGLAEDADAQHVIYEVLLKEGYRLNAGIEALEVETNKVYRVTDEDGMHSFFICLDEAIAAGTAAALELERETTFVCLDTALDDSQKVNLAMQCQLKVI